jgi:acid phosphatase (class A)
MQTNNYKAGRITMGAHARAFGWLCTAILVTSLTTPFAAWGRDANYVPSTKIALELILSPPPAPGSQAQSADLKRVLDVQKSRTESEAKDSQDDAQLSSFRVGDMLGPRFTPEKLPFTAQFLRRAVSDMGDSVGAAKDHFGRPRPFQVSQDVKPTVKLPGGGSYPSGHATFAYLSGILIAAMVPEKSREIFERANRYAYNRVVAGVHFPTDVEAGRVSASVIANALMQEPRFKSDFECAKSEVRSALALDGVSGEKLSCAVAQ